mgnify:CR=1 FL=1
MITKQNKRSSLAIFFKLPSVQQDAFDEQTRILMTQREWKQQFQLLFAARVFPPVVLISFFESTYLGRQIKQ